MKRGGRNSLMVGAACVLFAASCGETGSQNTEPEQAPTDDANAADSTDEAEQGTADADADASDAEGGESEAEDAEDGDGDEADEAQPSPEAQALDQLISSMQRLRPADGGRLTEAGGFAEVVEGAIPFDVELRVATDESGRVYFYFEGPPGVLDKLAFEFDALAEDGFTLVSETGLIGGQGNFPPWSLQTPLGSLLTMNESPFPFATLPERVGGVLTSDITTADDFYVISVWLYAGLEGGHFTYGHFEVLVEELIARLDPAVLRQVQLPGLAPSAANGAASVGWVDRSQRFLADLSIKKKAEQGEVDVGDTVTWVISVTNDGPQTTKGVVVRDQLPDCVEFDSMSTNRGSYDELTGEWEIGELKVGDTVELTITATVGVDCGDELNNVAEIFASSLPDPDDSSGLFEDPPAEVDDVSSAVVAVAG